MGINLGKQANASTETLNKKGTRVSAKNLQPGDMVFFDTYKKDGHVGIYMGNGKFLGAQSSTGVAQADMTKGYWKEKFTGHVRRVASGGSLSRADIGQAGANRGGGSSYTNTWKLKAESSKAPGYQAYKSHLRSALGTGKIDSNWVVALTELIGRESTWNPGVGNKKSSAWGYGQFLSSTRKQYEKKTKLSYKNPVNQIIMTAQYVKDRYGTPEKALAFWDKHNYY
jgi:hypothetical protein